MMVDELSDVQTNNSIYLMREKPHNFQENVRGSPVLRGNKGKNASRFDGI